MPWFAERFTGYLIRIGPDARAYGDEYVWSIPITMDGEIKGLSTAGLTIHAARVAIAAGRSITGHEPHWQRRPTLLGDDSGDTNQETIMPARKVMLTIEVVDQVAPSNPDDAYYHKTAQEWHYVSDAGVLAFEKAIAAAEFGLAEGAAKAA